LNQKPLRYDETVDIWAFGIVLYRLVVGILPFPRDWRSAAHVDAVKAGQFTPIGPEYSEDFRTLIMGLFQVDPEARLSAAEALQHPFYTRGLRLVSQAKAVAAAVAEDTERFTDTQPL
jgi:serine/threonine protein kinase